MGDSGSDVLVLPSQGCKGPGILSFLPLGSQLPCRKSSYLRPPCCEQAQPGHIGGSWSTRREQNLLEPSTLSHLLLNAAKVMTQPMSRGAEIHLSPVWILDPTESERIITVVLNHKFRDNMLCRSRWLKQGNRVSVTKVKEKRNLKLWIFVMGRSSMAWTRTFLVK